MSSPMLSAKGLEELADVLRRYPTKQAALLPLLHLVQKEHGFVSAEAEVWIGQQLGMAPVKVHEVLTFYTMLCREPRGRFHLQVCRTLPCALRGAGGLLAHIKARLGLKDGGVTPDRVFSLQEVECLGACGNAPVVQVNDDYRMDLSAEKLEQLLTSLGGEAQPAAKAAQAAQGGPGKK